MNILSIGPFSSQKGNNTSKHRSESLKKLGHNVTELDSYNQPNLYYKIINKLSFYGIKFNLPDLCKANKRILDILKHNSFDIIWIDKGNTIKPETLNKIKKYHPNTILVHYMIDDFMNPYHKTKQIMDTIPLYDYYVVNRKVNIEELKSLNCKRPLFTFMSYEDSFHYPREISEKDIERLGGDVGFIGTYEEDRAKSICYLADNGIKVRVWGNGWDNLKNYSENLLIEGKGLYSDDFCKAIKAFKINLGFLRKKSRDLHTTRSSEIPACGGFMLAERTIEHEMLFNDRKEACFFNNNTELLDICKYYLNNENNRIEIAERGYNRSVLEGNSNIMAISRILDIINREV